VKEGGGGEGSARGSVHWGCYYATSLDIEVDPQRRRVGCCESDFALQLRDLGAARGSMRASG
jgi:hypothetical protein